MSTILVTGATGFIGSRLSARLLADGHEVHGVWRSAAPDGNARDAISWSQAELSDLETTRALVRRIRPDYIFHLASRVSGSRDLGEVVPMFQSNLASSVNLLTAAAGAGCKRVLMAGSSEEPVEDGATPCSPYAAAKISSTAYAHLFRSIYGLSVVVPRIFMTYGPGQKDISKIVPYTILAMLRGERPRMSSGKRLVDWIYVDDVVDGLVKAAFTPHVDQVTFDLGSGELVSIRSFVEMLADIVGNGVRPEFGAIPDRPAEPERRADTSFAETALGWKPSTPLRAGLERSVEWYSRLSAAAQRT